jgi:molybdate transport system substrate-binding protein
MKRRLALGAIAACLLAGVSARASAAEIHVMISGGLTAAYRALGGEFEREAGHRLITVYGASMGTTPTAIPVRLGRGEQADVIVVARQALDAMVDSGKVRRGSETDLVRSPIGMAVRAGAAVPDIRTVEGLRQTLLAAKSIAYSDSASGVYVSTELFHLLGIEQVAAKARRIDGTPVAEIVARGEAEIGFQQLSELLPVKGVTVVGTIPDAVQRITVFSAGIAASSANAAAGRELIDYLSSRKAWRAMRESGVEPIERTR